MRGARASPPPPRALATLPHRNACRWLPFIGWYRNWVCEDIFVRRSFKQDEISIRQRIQEFRETGTTLMLFLSPEGMIVDRNELGRLYTENCKKFCREQGYPEFDYVLTPRYKGITVLSEARARAKLSRVFLPLFRVK